MRRRALLAALPLLAACGFAPAFGPGESGAALRGRVAVEAPTTPDAYAIRDRIEARLGPPGPGAFALAVAPEVTGLPAAVEPDGTITRTDYEGRAAWTLSGPGGVVAEGAATAFTGASATGTTVATRLAEADARARLMVLLADAIVTRLLALPPEALEGSP